MAKDAKGHGSEKRGARAAAEKAHNAAYGPYGFGTSASYKASHSDQQAASELAQGGGPKATAAPIHGGASGPSGRDPANSSEERARIYGQRLRENIKAFTDKYGGPRDHAAEQRAFNSGKREINRLRRQGK